MDPPDPDHLSTGVVPDSEIRKQNPIHISPTHKYLLYLEVGKKVTSVCAFHTFIYLRTIVIFTHQYFTLLNHLKIIIHDECTSFHQHYNISEDNYWKITHDINSRNILI